MKEYEIYLPTTFNDGTLVPEKEMQHLKDVLTKTFGGYTHMQQRNEGAWSVGGVTFHDEVSIMRVLDDCSASFDVHLFKLDLEVRFKQDSILIVRREVSVVT